MVDETLEVRVFDQVLQSNSQAVVIGEAVEGLALLVDLDLLLLLLLAVVLAA